MTTVTTLTEWSYDLVMEDVIQFYLHLPNPTKQMTTACQHPEGTTVQLPSIVTSEKNVTYMYYSGANNNFLYGSDRTITFTTNKPEHRNHNLTGPVYLVVTNRNDVIVEYALNGKATTYEKVRNNYEIIYLTPENELPELLKQNNPQFWIDFMKKFEEERCINQLLAQFNKQRKQVVKSCKDLTLCR